MARLQGFSHNHFCFHYAYQFFQLINHSHLSIKILFLGHVWDTGLRNRNEKFMSFLFFYFLLYLDYNQEKKQEKKLILMQTKTHSCKDFDSSFACSTMIHLHFHSYFIPMPAYQVVHPTCKISAIPNRYLGLSLFISLGHF